MEGPRRRPSSSFAEHSRIRIQRNRRIVCETTLDLRCSSCIHIDMHMGLLRLDKRIRTVTVYGLAHNRHRL